MTVASVLSVVWPCLEHKHSHGVPPAHTLPRVRGPHLPPAPAVPACSGAPPTGRGPRSWDAVWPSCCSAPPGQVWLSLSHLALHPHHNGFSKCQPQSASVAAPEQLSWVHATPFQVCPTLCCLALQQHPALVPACQPQLFLVRHLVTAGTA